jgi:DNA-binding NarL/FixJ family response regulator
MGGTQPSEAPNGAPDRSLRDDPERGEQQGSRIVIADDDVLLREGLASLLHNIGYEPVGVTGDAVELLELVERHQPDLAIVDVRMPPSFSTEGLEAARAIRASHPNVGVVVLSAHVEVEDATELLSTGGPIGYLLKGRVTDVDEFAAALERVARGGTVIDPTLVRELLDVRRRNDPLAELSEREREVLALMAEGLSNSGIARRLWVTDGTVEKHVHNILAKLEITAADDVHRRVLAVVRYLELR